MVNDCNHYHKPTPSSAASRAALTKTKAPSQHNTQNSNNSNNSNYSSTSSTSIMCNRQTWLTSSNNSMKAKFIKHIYSYKRTNMHTGNYRYLYSFPYPGLWPIKTTHTPNKHQFKLGYIISCALFTQELSAFTVKVSSMFFVLFVKPLLFVFVINTHTCRSRHKHACISDIFP